MAPILADARTRALLNDRTPASLNASLRYPRPGIPGWHVTGDDGLLGFALLNIVEREGVRAGKIVECLLRGDDPDRWHAAIDALARELKAQGKQVFIDWKLHDIGATVERAARALSSSGCDLLTVHAEPQVMAAAVRGCEGSGLKILAVTVLTSLTDDDLVEMGFHEDARTLVERRIRQALAAGCHGVVGQHGRIAVTGCLHRVQQAPVQSGLSSGRDRRLDRAPGQLVPEPQTAGAPLDQTALAERP